MQRLIAALAVLVILAAAARAEEPKPIRIELNKLEATPQQCRAYLVLANSGPPVAVFRLDLVLFDRSGVIAKRFAVDAGPLRTRTTVQQIDIPGIACGDLSALLLNDITACRDDAGDHDDCIGRVDTASKAAIPLNR